MASEDDERVLREQIESIDSSIPLSESMMSIEFEWISTRKLED